MSSTEEKDIEEIVEIKEEIDFIEYLTTEKEDDTKFGKFLTRCNRFLFKLADIILIIFSTILQSIKIFERYMFPISLVFGFGVMLIAYMFVR